MNLGQQANTAVQLVPPELGADKLYALVQKTLHSSSAVQFLTDETCLATGSESALRVANLAAHIATHVPEKGRVAISLPNSSAAASSILATLSVNRVPVLLNPSLTAAEQRVKLRVSESRMLIAQQTQSHDCLPHIPVLLISNHPDSQVSVLAASEGPEKTSSIARVSSSPLAGMVLFTSGSSGEPKCVVLPETAVVYNALTLISYFGLGRSTRATVVLPLHHTMALNTQFLPTFLAGGRCTFIRSEMSLGRVFRDILGSAGNFISLVADMLPLCFEEMQKRNLPPARDVKHVQLAGGIILQRHLDMAKALFPNALLHKGYGLTEAIRVSMINSEDPAFMSAAVGRALPGQEIQIRSSEGKVQRAGVTGEIYVKGPNVMLGYTNAEPQPFTGDFLATGDSGWIDEQGMLFLQGRNDSIFKSQGRRIAAREIEEISLKHPAVLEARCLPVPCPHKGLRPALFIETNCSPAQFLDSSKAELEKLLLDTLEPYKIPKDVVLVKFPRSGTGKISVKELQMIWENAPSLTFLGRGPLGCRFHAGSRGNVDLVFARKLPHQPQMGSGGICV